MKPRLARRAAAPGLCAVVASFFPSSASGQTLPVTPDSGTEVRIWRRGAWNWEQATFLRLAGDSLVMIPRRCCGIDTMPMREVQALAVIVGRERRVARILGWAAWGAVVGAGAGVIAARLVPCEGELCGIGVIFIVPWTVLGGVIAGGLLGSRKVDRWQRVYPSDGAALIVAPTGGGRIAIALGLRL